MSDLVLRFESGEIVDLRSWPIKVWDAVGSWRVAVKSDGSLSDIKDAVYLSPEEIAALDTRSNPS